MKALELTLIIFLFVWGESRLLASPPEKTDLVIPLTTSEFLPPGKFEWQTDLSTEGEVSIQVNLSSQILEVYRGEILIARSSISSGRTHRSTPNGVFSILEKEAVHYSNLYNNAPMPFMQRLTMEGLAIHAGALSGVPASHGCIRIPDAFARRLFQITSKGNAVHIFGDSSQYSLAAMKNKQSRLPVENRIAKQTVVPLSEANISQPKGEELFQRQTEYPRVQLVYLPSKKMGELEREELQVRNDISLSQTQRQRELNRLWAEQRALAGKP